MKKIIVLFIAAILMISIAAIAFAYQPCYHVGCKGRITKSYGPRGEWLGDSKMLWDDSLGRWYFIRSYRATVYEKCSENSAHNCEYEGVRKDKIVTNYGCDDVFFD